MGVLAGRLKQVLRSYGLDPEAHRPDLDALQALERDDQTRARDLYWSVRERAARQRLRDELARLRRHLFIPDAPDLDPEHPPLKEVEKLLRETQAHADAADRIRTSLQEAREAAKTLRQRDPAVRFDTFQRIPYAHLPQAATDADNLRRRIAGEVRIEQRIHDAQRRARRLHPRHVTIPDLTTRAIPDPGEADAQLDRLERELTTAERINTAHANARKPLRDAAVRHHARDRAKKLHQRIDHAAHHPDGDDAVAKLERLQRKAERLREDAAARASKTARARRRGLQGPERERRSTDWQDGYG